MKKINTGRTLLGGIVAAFIINLIEWLMNGVVLKADWAAAMQALNRPPDVSSFAIAIYNIVGVMEGIIGVWMYAAICSRYGAGPVTRAKAGLVTWALASLVPNLIVLANGIFPARLMTFTVVVDFVAILLGITMGAILYKESPEPVTASAGA